MAGPVTCLSCLTRATASSRLPARQREVLVAIALSDAPIDVLAERLNTTRGVLCKTLHDARQKLRAALAGLPEMLGTRECRIAVLNWGNGYGWPAGPCYYPWL